MGQTLTPKAQLDATLVDTTSSQTLSGKIINGSQLVAASVSPTALNTGGASATVATLQSTTSSTFADLATAGPSVTVTIGSNGLALVIISADLANSVGGDYAVMGFVVSGANTIAATFNNSLFFQQPGGISASGEMGASYSILLTGLTTGSTTFKAQYEIVTGGTGSFRNRVISVIPL